MVFYILYQNVIWTAIISALAGAAIVLLICLIKRKKSGGKAQAAVQGGKLSDKQLVIRGLRDNAGEFSELYEPIYGVAAGKTVKQEAAFTAFEDAVCNLEDDLFMNAYEKMFSGCKNWGLNKKGKGKAKNINKVYSKKARELVKLFFKAGLVRENDSYIVADDTTEDKYEFVGGVLEEGNTYEVLAPYWHLGDDVVDKGVIR